MQAMYASGEGCIRSTSAILLQPRHLTVYFDINTGIYCSKSFEAQNIWILLITFQNAVDRR